MSLNAIDLPDMIKVAGTAGTPEEPHYKKWGTMNQKFGLLNLSLPVWKQRVKSQIAPLILACLQWGTKMNQKLHEEPKGTIFMSGPSARTAVKMLKSSQAKQGESKQRQRI